MQKGVGTYFAESFFGVVKRLVNAGAFLALQHALFGDGERSLRVEQHLLHDRLAFQQVLELGVHRTHLVRQLVLPERHVRQTILCPRRTNSQSMFTP